MEPIPLIWELGVLSHSVTREVPPQGLKKQIKNLNVLTVAPIGEVTYSSFQSKLKKLRNQTEVRCNCCCLDFNNSGFPTQLQVQLCAGCRVFAPFLGDFVFWGGIASLCYGINNKE